MKPFGYPAIDDYFVTRDLLGHIVCPMELGHNVGDAMGVDMGIDLESELFSKAS